MYQIKIRYLDGQMPRLSQIQEGDWIDLRVCSASVVLNTEYEVKAGFELSRHNNWNSRNKIYYQNGDVVVCRLGVSMELPEGYKAKIYPRSSTFKTHGLLLSNSVGCIDSSFNGEGDEWIVVFYATRSGSIERYERLAQFDIVKSNDIQLKEVKSLGNDNRGGFGTTGKL